MRTTWLLSALLAVAGAGAMAAPKGEYLVYVGSTSRDGQGIYAWRFDSASGKLSPLGLVAETPSPSFLTIHPNRKWLYAVSEMKGGAVNAFSRDAATGKLTLLNTVSTRGDGPCYVTTDKAGRNVVVANYSSGSFAVLPIKDDGSLAEASGFVQDVGGSGVDKSRQSGPFAHCLIPSPDNRFLVGADLGLDQVLAFRFDAAKGGMAPNDPPFARTAPGAGPRHLDFHPNGRFLYAINELNSTVTPFAWDAARGALKPLETVSTLPPESTVRNSGADLHVHPNGRFLYSSNRGHDSIAVFGIDSRGGLKLIEAVSTGGQTPRNFGIDPTGAYLFAANQRSNSIVLFRIDAQTGRLTPTGGKIDVPTPMCVKFVAAE